MAQKMTVLLIDDLDGQESDEHTRIDTVTFGLDGSDYEIDLTESNQEKLRGALSPFLDKARKVGKTSSASKAKASTSVKSEQDYDAKAVRSWAAANNVEVPARGRIPKTVLEQYRSAGN